MKQFVCTAIFLFIVSLSYAQVFIEKNKVLLLGQITNDVNGAPIKNHPVLVNSDSIYNVGFQYSKQLYTDHEGYYYDTIVTDINKGGLIVSTFDYLNNCYDTTVYFRFNWDGENTLFANFVLPDEPPAFTYQANFYYQRNPSGDNIMEYQFFDITNSSAVILWLWNFGDGNFSYNPNPVHIFAEPGIYRVKLTVLIQPTPNSIPFESSMVKIISVKEKSYFSMGGHVKAGYFPIDLGEAYLYKIESQKYILIDTAIFNDTLGYYLFPQVIEGMYLVKADLHPNSVLFNQYMTTYYSNKPIWTEADTIFLYTNNFEYDIDLIPVVSNLSGPGTITGTIQYGSDEGYQKGQPAINVEILLCDEDDQPLICCHSDVNGEFCLDNINLGQYKVHAEVTGKYTYPVMVNLYDANPEVDDVLLIIGSHTVNGNVFAVNDVDWSFTGNPYPNPAGDIINLDLQVIESNDVAFAIYNNNGQILYKTTEFLSNGSNTIKFDIRSLPYGTYYISIIGQKDYIFKKFIKH